MKKFLFASGIGFSVTLAIILGFRMSSDALAVIVGIIAGVLASLPTSLVLVWVLRQRDRQLEAETGPGQAGHYPPVIVVNGQGAHGAGSSNSPMLTLGSTPPGSRSFKVIGQENTETVGDFLPPIWDQE